uniref:MSP domain-containing protein n=1 Tax=Oryza rufipogon TaxID=4529 RepID=A0A0E0PLM7_ORYRU
MVPTPPGPHASRPQKPYPTETKTPPPPTPQLEARNRRRVGGGVPVPVPSVVRPVRPPPRRLPPPSVSTVSPARLFSSTSNHQAAAHTRRDPDASADSDQQPLATSPSPVSDATRPAAAAMGSVDFGLVEIHPGEIRFEFEVKKKIIMQAQMIAPPDLQIRDKFLVQTTIVPFGTADEDIAPAFFSKEVGRYIEENKLRVVLVSATQLEEQQLIAGVPSAKTGVEVRVAKETLNIESEASNVTNEVHHSLKTNFPPLRENPATLNEMPFPVTDDVQNLMTKLSNLEAKLEEAESVIVKLREDTRTTIRERDKLKHEMVVLTRKGASRSQAGFPLLFVVYMAILGASLGYLLHL